MTGARIQPSGASAPVVFDHGGLVYANSRDVAAYFAREHRNVLASIDKLIAAEPSLCPQNFKQTWARTSMPNGGTCEDRHFDMTRDGFSLLAMGFSGSQALKFKLAYIQAFNAVERTLRSLPTDPTQLLGDPAALRRALLTYTEQLMDAETRVQELAPKAAALERLAGAGSSTCISDAAKTLQIGPRELFTYLRQNGWIYRRADSAHDVAYQSKIDSGDLEHRLITLANSRRAVHQVRVTAKGVAKLAKLLSAECGQHAGRYA